MKTSKRRKRFAAQNLYFFYSGTWEMSPISCFGCLGAVRPPIPIISVFCMCLGHCRESLPLSLPDVRHWDHPFLRLLLVSTLQTIWAWDTTTGTPKGLFFLLYPG